MELEECKKKDGKYFLLECEEYLPEFQAIVKDGNIELYQIILQPFSFKKVNEKDFELKCSLYESKDWEDESKEELIFEEFKSIIAPKRSKI